MSISKIYFAGFVITSSYGLFSNLFSTYGRSNIRRKLPYATSTKYCPSLVYGLCWPLLPYTFYKDATILDRITNSKIKHPEMDITDRIYLYKDENFTFKFTDKFSESS